MGTTSIVLHQNEYGRPLILQMKRKMTKEENSAANAGSAAPIPESPFVTVHTILAALFLLLSGVLFVAILFLASHSSFGSSSSVDGKALKLLEGTWRASTGIMLSFDKKGTMAVHSKQSHEIEKWKWSIDLSKKPARLKLKTPVKHSFRPDVLYTLVSFPNTKSMNMSEANLTHWPMRSDGGNSLHLTKVSQTNPEYYTRANISSIQYLTRFISIFPGATLKATRESFFGMPLWTFETKASPEILHSFYLKEARKRGWTLDSSAFRETSLGRRYLHLSKGSDLLLIGVRRVGNTSEVSYTLGKKRR